MSGWLDVGTEFGAGLLAPHAARLARSVIATSAGRAGPATLRAVRATCFILPFSFGIGTVSEVREKGWERSQEAREEAGELAKKRNTAAPRKSSTTGHHPIK